MESVEIFKTNVTDIIDATLLLDKLCETFPELCINFDLHDCDKILRVEGFQVISEKIISYIRSAGFYCERIP